MQLLTVVTQGQTASPEERLLSWLKASARSLSVMPAELWKATVELVFGLKVNQDGLKVVFKVHDAVFVF